MPITTGNFQDLVQLSQDTLYHIGPDFELGNTSVGSSASIGFNNTAGDLQLVGAATGNATVFLPVSNGTLLEAVNISAGTTSNNLSAVTFSNSNNVSFGLNGSTITASATVASTQGSINFSAGTTSGNLQSVIFSNSNGVSFGLNGSTITASVIAGDVGAIAAGTQTGTSGTFLFSNSNNITFGMSGSSRITASYNFNVSAGTTSNNLNAVTFANSNGISFGLNGSVVTAQNGGMSSWSNGNPSTAMTGGQNTLFFQPIIVPYALTATNLLWLASQTNHATNSSGGLSVSAALYTLNAGTALSLASSASTNLTWTSGAALSSNTGINYQQMSMSWVVTPGVYLFAWWVSTQNSASMSYYGPAQQPAISSGQVAAMSNLMLEGYSQATTNALPSSFGLSNTASYIRTGATAAEQPFIIMQGT